MPPKEALSILEKAISSWQKFYLQEGREFERDSANIYNEKDIEKIENLSNKLYNQFLKRYLIEAEIVTNFLEEIFSSFVYIEYFKMLKGNMSLSEFESINRPNGVKKIYEALIYDIPNKVRHLEKLYFKIEENIRSPLSYLKNCTTLCYYDFVCELKADTKESLLCEYMFNFSIGSKKEIIDIYCFIEGEKEENLLKFGSKKIINAMEGVNKKTKEFFGFSIFKKEKSIIYVSMKH